MGSDNPAALQSVIQQRDLLQSGLLSTCRELSRITSVSTYTHTMDTDLPQEHIERVLLTSLPNQELERSWREYDMLEGDVSLAKSNLLEQLQALGSPQVWSFLRLKLHQSNLAPLLLSFAGTIWERMLCCKASKTAENTTDSPEHIVILLVDTFLLWGKK